MRISFTQHFEAKSNDASWIARDRVSPLSSVFMRKSETIALRIDQHRRPRVSNFPFLPLLRAMPPPGLSSQTTLKRIHREIADLKKEDLNGLKLAPDETNVYLWRATIPGPEGSLYEGGSFDVEIHLPADYPCVARLCTIGRLLSHSVRTGSRHLNWLSRQGA